MRTLEYIGLDRTRVGAKIDKVRAALERDDFRSADVKKLASAAGIPLFRAKLDDANRLILTFVRRGEETCALLLEVVEQHAYDKSRFLRGAQIDEARVPDIDLTQAGAAHDALAVRYLHPERREIHLLDKVLSFDSAQDAVWRMPAPLVVVGSAGSGKTALVLEKIKAVAGDVLYVTQSSYLAENAQALYYANGFEREGQQVDFLSYREFLESIRVPEGQEAHWSDFVAWFARHRVAFREFDAHQAFEEIRGVLTADERGPLDRAAYLALGVRQSIFVGAQRERLYDLFERYRAWLKDERRFDIGLTVQAWRPMAQPRYDFIVIDEAQDLTAAQIALALATLRSADRFLLCGDSNQIVHPNFFSWSRIKTLLWGGNAHASQVELQVLRANFRNSRTATRVANALLKVKHARFGSIDRESNFLVEAVGSEDGEVVLLPDKESVLRDLDARIRRSVRFAVLVLRDEDKAAARAVLRTPLVFSVREAKGLEYDSIVLFRIVSGERARFAEIAEGVDASDLAADDFEYRRARDKSDKSAEIYKFFINALYVALTRAVSNVYLVESDPDHPLLELLQIPMAVGASGGAEVSSIEAWQREARRLELQGKLEQADSIRTEVLGQTAVPWKVEDEAWLRTTIAKIFRDRVPGSKPRQQLLEHAACHDLPALGVYLTVDPGRTDEIQREGAVLRFERQRPGLLGKHLQPYAARNFREVLRQCDRHGVDHRTTMNLTPLMAAAAAGNAALVDALLERGADTRLHDHFGRAAVHWALATAFLDPSYAQGAFAAIFDRVAPPAVDLRVDERLIRIDRHLSEYLPWQTLWTLYGRVLSHGTRTGKFGFDTSAILAAWKHLPPAVLRAERAQRAFLSGLLARNEVERDYAYNRRLFCRVAHGLYHFNMKVDMRGQGAAGEWIPVVDALNLSLVKEVSTAYAWDAIDAIFAGAGRSTPPMPSAGAAEYESLAAFREWNAPLDREAAARDPQGMPTVSSSRLPDEGAGTNGPEVAVPNVKEPASTADVDEIRGEPNAPWGTPRAKAQALARLARQIELQRRAREENPD
jgi:hypothetical protein